MRPLVLLFTATALLAQAPPEPEGISDNSFLVEEAYNQEKGVVQHIFTWQKFRDTGAWMGTFTQEWPAPGQTHQLSFTAPWLRLAEGGTGLGDVALNYRLQVLGGDDKDPVSFSPRLSLLLPTGDERAGRGNGALGYQVNLPLSVNLGPSWVTHWNLGTTYIPKAKDADGNKADLGGWNAGASLIWKARPTLNFMFEAVYGAQDSVAGPGQTQRQKTSFLNPGVRWAHNFASGLQIVPGLAYTHGIGASKGDNAVFLYLSFEHPFR